METTLQFTDDEVIEYLLRDLAARMTTRINSLEKEIADMGTKRFTYKVEYSARVEQRADMIIARTQLVLAAHLLGIAIE